MMSSAIQLIILLLGIQVLLSDDSQFPSCKTCQTSSQAPENEENISLCRCDDLCTLYGDCCPDADIEGSPVLRQELSSALPYMQCHVRYRDLPLTAIGDAYYMVSSCPTTDQMQDEEFAGKNIAENCTSFNTENFPPVSDSTTGITYRNEFCAICHQVNTSNLMTWPTRLLCEDAFQNISLSQDITLNLINQYCSRCSFDPPNNTIVMDTLRWCIPVESTCPPFTQSGISDMYNETEYEEIVENCRNGDFNPIHQLLMGERNIILRNPDCAKCKSIQGSFLSCIYLIPFQDSSSRCGTDLSSITFGPVPFSVLLDFSRKGLVRVTSTKITDTDLVICDDQQVFDPVIGCRDIVCPRGYVFTSGVCTLVPPQPTMLPDINTNQTTITNNGNGNGNDTMTNMIVDERINDTSECYNNTLENCTNVISLNQDTYMLVNNCTVLFRGREFKVIGYNDSNGQPLICGMRRFNFPGFPPGYIELTFTGKVLSIVSSICLTVTFAVFKELRTLPSKLLVNLAVAFLMSDILFIISGFVSRAGPLLCFISTVLVNFFTLCRFSWMNCLGLEYTRTIYKALSLQTVDSALSKGKLFIIYTLLGWGSPIIMVAISVVINFASRNTRNNRDLRQGLCWMNGEALISAYVVPISVSTTINIVLFFTVIVFFFLASKSSVKELRSKHNVARIRVIIGIFSVLGLTWIFGFISLLARSSWAWYVFSVFNSVQPLIITVSFLVTRKIASLYLLHLRKFAICKKLCNKNQQTENEQNLETISTG